MMDFLRLDRGALAGGFLASALLLAGYFLIVGMLGGSAAYAWSQFLYSRYWLLALAAGFGLQIAFFLQLRRNHATGSGGAVAVSGTVSTAAMLSCCTHYLVNILPFLGIAGAAVFIGRYQQEIFALGLFANLAGLVYLGRKLKQNQC